MIHFYELSQLNPAQRTRLLRRAEIMQLHGEWQDAVLFALLREDLDRS